MFDFFLRLAETRPRPKDKLQLRRAAPQPMRAINNKWALSSAYKSWRRVRDPRYIMRKRGEAFWAVVLAFPINKAIISSEIRRVMSAVKVWSRIRYERPPSLTPVCANVFSWVRLIYRRLPNILDFRQRNAQGFSLTLWRHFQRFINHLGRFLFCCSHFCNELKRLSSARGKW